MKQKRKTDTFIFRINSQDLDRLEKDSKSLNLTKSQLLRLYIRNKELSNTLALLSKNIEFNNAMLLQISRIAGNINQIAYKLNANEASSSESLLSFKKEADSTRKIFDSLGEYFKKNNKKFERLYL
ncbi:hypothetical protein CQA53_05600 [Helicobacter didelphidarum]|uniref:Bacterial mobilisation domain-containing protein n=1 Tax=Helicobacter didelphidarum TaxID=2040648 RepID=A0A3D8IKN1_9HELI|nr:plasmid mobilization relaxosome protein MobC [Helicobacter didelphidarum]RDU65769.1 hypothetical protein CQA53_05600 [Helicobacter didelphidarum]